MLFPIPYSILLLPVLGCGAAVTSMMLDIPRKEVNIRRVERATLAFWMSMAVILSTQSANMLA
jgi:hypothetical protein